MTATAISKLPMNERPIITDPDLAAAVEEMLAPYTGRALERAQAAVRRVAMGATQGTFGDLVEAYRKAIKSAVNDKGDG
jgi:hypothetical protein